MSKIAPHAAEIPWFGKGLEFAKDSPNILLKMAQEYGEVVQFHLFGYEIYLVTNPDLVREVLVTKIAQFPKSEFDIQILSKFVGYGLVTANGEAHRRQRQLVQPAFHTNRIQNYAETMVQYTDDTLKGWVSGETKEISREMAELTMYVVSKTLFDVDRDNMSGMAQQIGQTIHEIQAIANSDFNFPIPIPDWLPTSKNQRRKRAKQVLDATIDGIVAQRRATSIDGQVEDRGDLLSMLLLARDDAGTSLTDDEIREQAATLFIAGHETTSNALTWTWHLLSQYPQIEAKLHTELDQQLGGRLPTVHDLRNLPYTEKIIKESLRLYPPAWVLNGRQATEDTTIGDYHIPKGATIFISPYVLHRLPQYFAQPDLFDPERFAPENEKLIPRYAYIPFGAGARVCIGNSFAMMEARLILATIAQRYRLQLTPDQKVTLNPQITLSPKHGLPMHISQRKPVMAVSS